MATEALKSATITNLDASPIVPLTTGEGAAGRYHATNDYVTTTAGVTVGSTYKIIRIPFNAKIKKVLLTCAAHGGSSASDFSVAWSDSTTDGTPPTLQGNIVQVSAADNKLFGSAQTLVSALKNNDQTFANTYTAVLQNVPLWQALLTLGSTDYTAALAAGFFDIVAKSTATDTSGGIISIEVDYVM